MGKEEFLRFFEELLELKCGLIKGNEKLETIEEWDSLATISFLGMVDRHYNVNLDAEKVVMSISVDDLFDLLNDLNR